MSEREDPRFDEFVASLLEDERKREGPSDADVADLWSNVKQGLVDAPDASNDGDASAPKASSKEDPSSGPSPAPSQATASVASSTLRWKMAALAAGAALVGGVSGAWIHAKTSAPNVVYVPVPASNVAPSATPPPPSFPPSSHSTDADVVEPPPSPSPPSTPPPRSSKSSSTGRNPPVPEEHASAPDAQLARERSLLDMGRTALARGDTSAAFAAIATLEKEAPNGQLVEEREVLAVQTLVTANRTAEARRRAAQFQMKYPTSPLLPIVEDAVSP